MEALLRMQKEAEEDNGEHNGQEPSTDLQTLGQSEEFDQSGTPEIEVCDEVRYFTDLDLYRLLLVQNESVGEATMNEEEDEVEDLGSVSSDEDFGKLYIVLLIFYSELTV